MSTSEHVSFAGLKFRGYNLEAIQAATDNPKFIVTVNADFIVRAHDDAKFKELINRNLSTFDGQVPYALAKLVNYINPKKIRKLSGSDLVYTLLQEAALSHKSSFLLGASPSANARAVGTSQALYGGIVTGHSPPHTKEPPNETWTENVLVHIQRDRPAYLFVALGAPKQEYWIAENIHKLRSAGVEVVMGCGGSIDFIAGSIRRAPKWIQVIGLEGVFRLATEPRLFRLQRLIRSFRIFIHVLK